MDGINKRISMVVEKSKLTKTAFAKRINVSQGLVSQICNGTTNPSERTIKDICREFDINEKWLRNGTGNMKIDTTQRQKLNRFFDDVLSTAPDDRSAFIAALDDLPAEFWPLVVKLAQQIVENIKNAQADSQPERRIIKIAGRDGSLEERALTDEELDEYKRQAEALPDAGDDL